ncbi:MAG: hypothetical protein NC417_06385 [Candidatus Gastranaerophilales bacterium]|nr:hypothetical protein [Candidatus Gastranaerophilales bacterium]
MRKAGSVISAVAGRVCLIGFGIQIVLGLLWMFCNFTGYQEFGDKYMGILYPVLVLIARAAGSLLPIPYYCILYLLQLAVALYAAHVFLQTIWASSRLWNLWGSLAMLTLPMAMQCHLAVLPESLISSFLLLELAWLWRSMEQGSIPQGRHLIKAAAFWLAAGLLKPDDLYLGAIPMILVWVYGMVRSKGREWRRTGCHLLLIVCCAGFLVGVNALTQEAESLGRVHRSVEASLFSRFSWSTLNDTYQMWSEEMRVGVNSDMIWEASLYSDNLMPVVGSAMEQYHGEERAKELFLEAARISYESYGARIRHEILWDLFGYGLAPAASEMLLQGRGYHSYCMRNYDVMRSGFPILTKYYYHYACWWFVAGWLLAGLLQCMRWCKCFLEQKKERKLIGIPWKKICWWSVVAVFSLGMMIWYAMQGGGIYDYKNTVAVSCVWMAWMVEKCREI